MSELTIEDHGLADDLLKVANMLPDYTYEYMEKEAKTFRKNVAAGFRNVVNTRGTKKSLGKMGSYKQSLQFVPNGGVRAEISATSPQFHLVERGHELLSHNGNHIGFVPGYLVMDEESKKFEDTFQADTKKFVDTTLKKGNL